MLARPPSAHVIIPKYILSPQTAAYERKTLCQSSMPASSYTANA